MKRISLYFAFVLGLLVSGFTFAADVNVLIIGSSKVNYSYNTSTNSAYDPEAVRSQLQSILAGAGYTSPNVVLEDRGNENGAANGGNLATWFHYPYPAGVERSDRWPNLRGEKGTQWDYIVLIPDPFAIERIPGYYTHGVALISEEVAKSANPAEIVLLMTWPNDDRAQSSVDHYKEVVYRTGRSGGFKVAPAGLAWQAANSPRDANYPSADGAYLAAASIYSCIHNQSADSNNNLANIAQTTFTNNDTAQHYTGKFSFNNPFQILGDKRRKIFTSDIGSSTERGYENNTVQAADRAAVDADPNTYGGAYSSNTPEDDGKGWNMSNPMPIALNVGRMGQYVINPDYWQLGFAFNYQTNYHTVDDVDIEEMQDHDVYTASSVLYKLPTVRVVPARTLFAWMNKFDESIHQTDGGEHCDGDVLGSYGTFMYTLYSGRCGVDANALPPGGADTNNTGEHVGYQAAWHMGRCEVRAPGFKAMPSDKFKLELVPGEKETMTVEFIYPPRETVTVNVSLSNTAAAIVSPKTLTFTPANYNIPQNVEIIGLPGNTSEDQFDVVYSSTSNDEVYNALNDSWAYTTTRSIPESLTRIDNETIAVQTPKNEAVSIVLGVTNADSSNTLFAGPNSGAISWSGSNLVYTPNTDFVGMDYIAYASEIDSTLTTGYVAITVTNSQPNATRVSIVADDAAAAEELSDIGSWVITRTGDTSANLNVNVTVSGNASAADYTLSSTSVTIPSSQASVTITLTPVDDSVQNEGDESAEMTIAPGTGYTPVAGTATILIADNDSTGIPAITFDSPTVSRPYIESGVGLILETTITKLGVPVAPPAVSLQWAQVSGPGVATFDSPNSDDTGVTFSADGEYSLSLTADDGIVPGSESITVIVGEGAMVGMWYGKVPDAQNYSDPNPQTTFLPDPSVETENGSLDGHGIGTKTTEVLTGRIYDADGVISFTEHSDEYVRIWVGGVLVLSDNDAAIRTHSGTVNVTPGWNDFEVRVGNKFGASGMVTSPGIGVDPQGGTDYQLLTDPGNGSFLRVDTNNIAPQVAAGPNDSGPANIPISLQGTMSDENNPVGATVTSNWIVQSGSAGAVFADSSDLSTTITCVAGGTYILRLIADDTEIKTFDDLTLTITGGGTVVSVSATDANASETGPDTGEWTISRTGDTSDSLTVNFTLSGTATGGGTDYNSSATTSVTITSGDSSADVTLTPVDDDLNEGDETATLTITSDPEYIIGTASGNITIADNDTSYTLTVTNGTDNTGNSPYLPGAVVSITANAPATGYSFANWSASPLSGSFADASSATTTYTMPTNAVTVTANYEADSYTVTFDKQSGTGGSDSVSATYDSPMPSATAPSRTGYAFGGYYTGTDGTGTQYYNADMSSAKSWDLDSDTTLFAEWILSTPPIVSTLVPEDNSSGVSNISDFVVTFDEDIVVGTGSITIKNLTDATNTVIDVTDGTQISISGSVLTINPSADLELSKDYAVQIEEGAVTDLDGNPFAGIADDTTWNFQTAGQLTVFSDDFEAGVNPFGGTTPDVASYTLSNTSRERNTTLWVGATYGYGGVRNGLIDETENSGANFTDPTGEQAYAFRYTNTGVTTAEGVIGTLTSGSTIDVSFDVCVDGYNGGAPYSAALVLFDPSADRTRISSVFTHGTAAVLASTSGDATGGSYETITLSYTVGDDVLDNDGEGSGSETTFLSTLLEKDIALRFIGGSSSANIDNVVVKITGGGVTTYTVTYDTNTADNGDVPVDANSPYDENATVTVLGNTGSLALTGYAFDGWNTAADGSGSGYVEGNTFNITENTTLYAQWTADTTYTLTVNNGTGGGSYAEGAQVAISATIPNGQHFVNWTGDTANLADANSADTTVTMPAAAVTVTANFANGDTPHSADTNSDWSISQTEVDSFISAYSGNKNSVSGDAGSITDGRITMREVMRVIYLYNQGGEYIGGQGTVDTYDIVAPAAASVTAVKIAGPGVAGDGSLVLSSSADSGVGSLRDAIAIAADGETIMIDDSVDTITVLSEIVIDKSITIDGQGTAIVTGENQTRIFRIENTEIDIDVTLKNIGIVDATNSSDEFGGGIYNNGQTLKIDTVLMDGNANIAENGKGGAVYSSGTLNVENCVFSNNSASEEDDVYSE